MEKSNYNTNKVDISAKLRKAICEQLDITQVSFSKSLKQLLDLKILKDCEDAYEIDPAFF